MTEEMAVKLDAFLKNTTATEPFRIFNSFTKTLKTVPTRETAEKIYHIIKEQLENQMPIKHFA